MRAHVRAVTPRCAYWRRRECHAVAGFQIRHANDDFGAHADFLAFVFRGESIVVAVATEVCENNAGFLMLVVEIRIDCGTALVVAFSVALKRARLMTTVAGKGIRGEGLNDDGKKVCDRRRLYVVRSDEFLEMKHL